MTLVDTLWIKAFNNNFILPEINSYTNISGWILNIKELRNFSLSSKLKTTPDTSTFGIKAYVSVFNQKAGMFQGKTWTSPLITDFTANSINLTAYALLAGTDSLIVIEFAIFIQYLSGETSESSLFFTIIPQPKSSIEQECPLYNGTPRFLLSHPQDFSTGLVSKKGELIIEFKKFDDLKRAQHYLPLFVFVSKPIPGIRKLAPLNFEQPERLIVSRIQVQIPPDFQQQLQEELSASISQKYNVQSSQVNLRIIKKLLHIGIHNTYKFTTDIYKAELNGNDNWTFDGQILLTPLTVNQYFAIVVQLVVNIEIDLSFIKNANFMRQYRRDGKQNVEVPIGFAVFIPKSDESVRLNLRREAQLSPFCVRIFNSKIEQQPIVTFDVSFTNFIGKQTNIKTVPFEFIPLTYDDGTTLSQLDVSDIPIEPLLDSELKDQLTGNHLIFLFKFIEPKQCYFQRFPISIFKRFIISLDLWPFGKIESDVCTLDYLQDSFLCFNSGPRKTTLKGVLIKKDIILKTIDHVLNYYLQMKSNEIQAIIIDHESGVQIGTFNIPSLTLLRQGKPSLQFPAHSNLISTDGELLGIINFSCGCYGTKGHEIQYPEFVFQNNIKEEDIKIAEPLFTTDKEFRKLSKTSFEPRYELANRYRADKKQEIILSELQKRFLRTIIISPVPGRESRFLFTSSFDTDEEETTIYINTNDEHLRLIKRVNSNNYNCYENPFSIERNEEIEFNQDSNLSDIERFHLITNDKIILQPNEELNLLFGYFNTNEINDNKQISVSLTNKEGKLVDYFTVQIRKTHSIVHENIYIPIQSKGIISTTILTLNEIHSVICSNGLINAMNSDFGIKLSSLPIDESLKCFLFLFAKDGTIHKIIQLHIDILTSEVLSIGDKLKLELKQYKGNKICCRTNDYRIVEFLNYFNPEKLKNDGEVVISALSAGYSLAFVWNLTLKKVIGKIIIKIKDKRINNKRKQKCIGKSEISLVNGESAKRSLPYVNKDNKSKKIKLTTTHPDLIMFDPTHYIVGPLETIKIRALFLPNDSVGDVKIRVFVHEIGLNADPAEYLKILVHYKKANFCL